ncbi:MAG TPA: hypothetical protein VMT10_14110 [Solirubrobacteraceae bacterium]|nr:hypothetical protein [Solirubrobacteraceae bacterium]
MALVVIAHEASQPGPATFEVVAVERVANGELTTTTLGSSLSTNDAGGLSGSVAHDGHAIISWPDVASGPDHRPTRPLRRRTIWAAMVAQWEARYEIRPVLHQRGHTL